MKIYNINEVHGEEGDAYVKDAVLIYGDKENIWEGKRLEECSHYLDAVLLHLKSGEEIKAHHHGESEEIVLVVKGSGWISQKEKKAVKEGDLVFLEAKIRHSFRAGEKGISCLCFHALPMHFRG